MDNLDNLFRGFRSGVTAPSEDAASAARGLLLGEIGSIERPPPSRPKRRWAFSAIAAAILVCGVIVTPAVGIGGHLLDLIQSAPGRPAVQAPVWSPGGQRIAFLNKRDGGKEIYVVSAEGGGQRRLTRDARYPATPAWSPDGRKIAFEGGPYALSGIYVVNADGSGQRRLANGHAPAWSPDGRTIAFFSDSKIYLMNADGTEHRALTKPLTAGGRSLAWSPEGRNLAFFSAGGSCQACFNLYVVNSDGSGLRKLTAKLAAGAGPGRGPEIDPAWSPDGQTIAFVALNASGGEPIYVVNADGSRLRNLTPKPVGAYANPTWSPNGRKIAFVSKRDGNSEIYVMNANGKGQRNLTRNPAYDADPAWSPDGRIIAFASNRDGNYGVYLMNANGNGLRKLAQHTP